MTSKLLRDLPLRTISRAALPVAVSSFCALLSLTRAESPRGVSAPVGASPPAPAAPAEDAYEAALAHYRAGRTGEALAQIDRSAARAGWSAALRSLAGWCHLREGSVESAETAFLSALALDPAAIDPVVGLGYALLRRGDAAAAAARFAEALRREPRHADALKGEGLALRARGRHEEAIERFVRAGRLAPDDAEIASLIAQTAAITPPARKARPRGPVPATAPLRLVASARAGRFFVGSGPAARPIFVKGVNFGVALPGRFPAEFPEDEATYAGWLEAMSEMGANVVRTYTLLPPPFYSALLEHNRRAGAPGRLWLVQGVWTELPEDDDYDAPAFLDGLREETRLVIDAVHGNLDLPARPGHARGRFRSDVSDHTLAWLLGREWEPHSVRAYEARALAAGRRPSRGGRYFTPPPEIAAFDAARFTPFEDWLLRLLDAATAYETERYREQRPAGFVSWPTLDPLRHPTEATVAEERDLLERLGVAPPPAPILEYDNDGVGVDATRIRPTAAAPAGVFAAYHAYPYYPDFMSLDPGYSAARDRRGPSNYVGYLRDLRRHHGDQPVLIAEVGVPSSRGMAHVQAQGWNHGGLSEAEQGAIDARLIGNIHEADLAGGIVFALLDEWFKRNWLVADLETPSERDPLWLNVLDPEENYGVLAARPGTRGWKIVIDGRAGDWSGVAPLASRRGAGPERAFGDGHDQARALRALSVLSDEAYLYLKLDVGDLDPDGDGAPDWDAAAYVIGIDTYDAARGDARLPLAEETRSPAGLEFAVVLDGEATGRLLVDAPYDLHAHRHHRPYRSAANDDGRFVEIRVETNRRRVGRDGTLFPAREHSRSPLVHGSIDPEDPDYTTLADWRAGVACDCIEVRLGWGLLNVADPSSRRVVHDEARDLRRVGTLETEGFRFYVASLKPSGARGRPAPISGKRADRLPAGDLGAPGDLPLYAWRGWERPTYRIEKKAAWHALREAFEALPPVVAP